MLEGLNSTTMAMIMQWLPPSARLLLLHTASDLACLAAQKQHSAEDASLQALLASSRLAEASEQVPSVAQALHAAVAMVNKGEHRCKLTLLRLETSAAFLPRSGAQLSSKAEAVLRRAYLTMQLAISVHLQALKNIKPGAAKYRDEIRIQVEPQDRFHLRLGWLSSALFGAHTALRLSWLSAMGDVSFWQEAICIQQLCLERAFCLVLPLKAYLLVLNLVAMLARVSSLSLLLAS